MTRRERDIAKHLGVTPVGLAVLGRMVAGGGVGPTAGMAGRKLIEQGHITEATRPYSITESGREIVLRARRLGW